MMKNSNFGKSLKRAVPEEEEGEKEENESGANEDPSSPVLCKQPFAKLKPKQKSPKQSDHFECRTRFACILCISKVISTLYQYKAWFTPKE